ncbi:MAG: NAD(+)/NADH kinase [Acidimicrobiales bacterium]
MARIGIVLHGADEQALTQAGDLAEQLTSGGHEVVGVVDDASRSSHFRCVEPHEFPDDLDLAISLGGDGTMLRTVGLLAGSKVKILGVNFGDLGYLTVTEPEHLETAVARSLAGDHEVEERMLLRGTVGGQNFEALNDIVVERAPGETTVRVSVAIDGERFTSYQADGLIVATPTGSTAYALSARGPIVEPTHESIQITPVSPHMLFDRTVVLSPKSSVAITVERHRAAAVSVDGNTMVLMKPGDTLTCARSPHVARLITFERRDHFAVLRAKLGLSDR